MSSGATVEDTTPQIYWRPGCPYCACLRRQLKRRGIDASWRNIWDDEQAAQFVREVNHGDETVPTVQVGTQTLTNPSAQQVALLVRGAPASTSDEGSTTVRGWLGRWLREGPFGMRSQSASPWWTTLVASSVAGTDLLTKTWAARHLATAASRQPRPWLSLNLLHNSGMSLGIGAGHPVLVVVIAVAATVLVAALLARASTPIQKMSLALVLGGAAGNLLDRVAHGSVTDWIRLAWYPASFNLADLAIRAGLLVVATAYVLGAHAQNGPVKLDPNDGNRPDLS